ncbi:MAG: hypothetical protein ACK5H2_08045 [Beutenbergiaceae bacterium]
MRFKVGYNRGKQATWWLYAHNGQLVAWAGEAFASLSNAQRAAAAFKAGAASARYEVYEDARGTWRWRAWRSSDKVAASGEAFSNQPAARRATDNVHDNARTATLMAA